MLKAIIKNIFVVSLLAGGTSAMAGFLACPVAPVADNIINQVAPDLTTGKAITPTWFLYQTTAKNGVTVDYYTQAVPNGALSDHAKYLAMFLHGTPVAVDVGATRHCYYPAAGDALTGDALPVNDPSHHGQLLALEYAAGVDPNTDPTKAATPVAPATSGWHPARLVIFGDSLSDMGYQDLIPEGEVTCPNGTKQIKEPTFTSPCGHVWPYYLAPRLGVPTPLPNNTNPRSTPQTSYVSGTLTLAQNPNNTDYAAGGSVAGGDDYVTPLTSPHYIPPQLNTQVDTFINAATPNANDLYIIWSGSNDIFRDTFNSSLVVGQIPEQEVITNILTAINSLRAFNPNAHILVLDIVDIGKTPMGALFGDIYPLTDISGQLDVDLSRAIDAQGYGKNVAMYNNMFYLIQNLWKKSITLQNPSFQWVTSQTAAFTFSNNRNPACTGAVINLRLAAITCDPIAEGTVTPWQYIYEDAVHPTDQTQQIVADEIYKQIDSTWINPA